MERFIDATARFPRGSREIGEGLGNASDYQKRGSAIVYIDNQRLTRDCVTEQLASRLPDTLIEGLSDPSQLSACGLDMDRFSLGILNKHSTYVREAKFVDELSCVAAAAPNLPLAVFSDLDEADDVAEAFKLGIRGYIPTNLPVQQAVEAIRLLSAGGSYLPPSILALPGNGCRTPTAARIEERFCSQKFTPRQLEVLRRLWEGKQNKLIAYDLNMCESTVKVHIRHIMKKLKARNRTQVVLLTRSIQANQIPETSG
jgi:DNA-binding NarL/FixJ family response regulator